MCTPIKTCASCRQKSGNREPLFIDIVVEDKGLVEVKATEKNHPIYETQVLTHLRLAGVKLGLLVNFGAPYVKEGVSRIINGIL